MQSFGACSPTLSLESMDDAAHRRGSRPGRRDAGVDTRDLDRCKMFVTCEGGCHRCVMVSVTGLTRKYGIDAKIAELASKLYCRTCGWRAPVGPYRPCGNDPFYF